jgi:hypothetical protein
LPSVAKVVHGIAPGGQLSKRQYGTIPGGSTLRLRGTRYATASSLSTTLCALSRMRPVAAAEGDNSTVNSRVQVTVTVPCSGTGISKEVAARHVRVPVTREQWHLLHMSLLAVQ